MNFSGVFPILATPFQDDGALDVHALDRLVGFMADLGVDGVTVLGVLGESNRMLDQERATLITRAVAAARGRTKVIVGASHPGTQATIGLCQMAAELGADAVMIAPSAEGVPSDARVFDYYAQVAAAMPLPLVVQDHPASTQVHMPVPLLLRLVNELPSVTCIKEEAVPTAAKVAALRAGMQQRRVAILTGLGALYGHFDLAAGADGFNTGFAFPEVLMAMLKAARAGDADESYRLYAKYLPLIVFEQQPGVAVRKELLRMRGLLGSAHVRHPGAPLSALAAEQLRDVVGRVLPGVDLTRPIVP
jgi:4-hydroxy-tetrahydrodipicolinate synthase